MMDDLELLGEMLKDTALAPTKTDPYGKKIVILEEFNNDPHPNYSLKVQNTPDEVLAIRADKFPAPRHIFRNNKGECKRADYILIAHTDTANWIIYIELKGGRSDSDKEIEQQLQGAECLVAYCRAVGRTFWQCPSFLEEKLYEQRFVSIKNLKVSKTPTRTLRNARLHDRPANMLKIDAPGSSLQFNRLIRKP